MQSSDSLHRLPGRRRRHVLPTTSSFSNRESSAPFGTIGVATSTATTSNDLLVFELTKDGGRRFFHMPVRGLYRYVLAAITQQHHQQQQNQSASVPEQPTAMIPPPPPAAATRRATTTDTTSTPRHTSSSNNNNNNNSITYRERLGGYLHPRDMRRLVTPFSATNEPALVMRRHVMVFHLDPLRAIITRDRLLVLVPTGADSILVQLEERVRNGSTEHSVWTKQEEEKEAGEMEEGETMTAASASVLSQQEATKTTGPSSPMPRPSSRQRLQALLQPAATTTSSSTSEESDGSNDPNYNSDDEVEWNEMRAHEWIHVPFELQCAEAVLYVVSSILATDTEELQQTAQQYLQCIVGRPNSNNKVEEQQQYTRKKTKHEDPLTILRVVKDAVHLMTNRVHGFSQSLTRVLNDDEDMALMNLSRLLTHPERFIQPVSQTILDEESDEPELILESHLHTSLTVMNALEVLQGQINNAKELVDQQQDATRNHLLLANMVISIVSLCVSVASLVGSLFGMNLPNPYETSASSFRTVTYGTVGATTLLCGLILAILWWSGTIPRTASVSIASSTESSRRIRL